MQAVESRKGWAPAVVAGLVAGFISAALAIALAALVFSGGLAEFLPTGIGAAMVGSAVIGLVVALRSSLSGMVGGVQENTSAVLALGAASIAARVASEALLPTVLALLAVAALLTGAVLYLLGRLQLGGLVRYIPYPVIGGFIAGTGFLLVRGSLQFIGGNGDGAALSGDGLLSWVPAVVLALVLLVGTRRRPTGLWLPGMLLGFLVAFHSVRVLAGVNLQEAAQRGLVLGGPDVSALWQPETMQLLQDADFGAVLSDVGTLATVVLLAMVSVLLYSTGLELFAERNIDLNKELRAAGLGNLAVGLLAGFPGFQFFSDTALAMRLAPARRLVGVVAALVPAAVLVIGGAILAVMPLSLVAALLLFMGLSFLYDWLVSSYRTLPRSDYVLVLIILGAIALFGFLQGVALGILIAIVLFILKYSRTDVVKHELSGASYRSNVDRDIAQARILDAEGDVLLILALQGYVFFGTANSVLEKIRQRLFAPDSRPLRFVVFDFRLVTGLDSSAVFSFERIHRLGAPTQVELVFTGLSQQVRGQLAGLLSQERVASFSDRDRGVQWGEEQILQGASGEDERSLEDRIRAELPIDTPVDRLLSHFRPMEIETGQEVLSHGEPSPGIFFVARGSVTAYLEESGGTRVRLRTMGPGAVVGEVGTYLAAPASASVVTEEPCSLLFLSAEDFTLLTEEDPDAAAALHLYVAKVLAQRVSQTSRTLWSVLG